MKVAMKTKTLQRYSDSVTIFEDTSIKVSLVTIDKGRPLPLHDHPGESGLMLVLEGSVNVCHCNLESAHTGHPVKLFVEKVNALNEGDVNWFTESERNIHSVDSIEQRAILLVVHTSRCISEHQSYYFPINGKLEMGAQVPVQKINAQTLRNASIHHVSTSQFEAKHA